MKIDASSSLSRRLALQFASGSFVPQAGAGAGSFVPQAGAGAGSFVPQAGAGSAIPQAELTFISSIMAFPPFLFST